ncbi:VOC family protein [Rathayibacter sp. YIM 133350]|uniref:VOC family protein n=1 Tax=Rathayibacter sp. YIM 133350 TaxID=3131992 RepID=UPI00307E7453
MNDVIGIDNVLFPVGDLDEARRLYGGTLAFDEDFAFPEIGMVGYKVGAETPGLIIRAADAPRSSVAAGPRLLLEVPDARATYEWLGARTGLPGRVYSLRTGYAFEFVDPWGNAIGFADYALAPHKARPN